MIIEHIVEFWEDQIDYMIESLENFAEFQFGLEDWIKKPATGSSI